MLEAGDLENSWDEFLVDRLHIRLHRGHVDLAEHLPVTVYQFLHSIVVTLPKRFRILRFNRYVYLRRRASISRVLAILERLLTLINLLNEGLLYLVALPVLVKILSRFVKVFVQGLYVAKCLLRNECIGILRYLFSRLHLIDEILLHYLGLIL